MPTGIYANPQGWEFWQRQFYLDILKRFIREECYDDLRTTVGFEHNQQDGMFQGTFGAGYLDSHQIFLAWLCLRKALPVRERLSWMSAGDFRPENCQTCTCGVSGDIAPDNLCRTCVATFWKSTAMSRVDLKGDVAGRTDKGRQDLFLLHRAILRECVWKTSMRGLVTNTFIFVAVLLRYFRYHLKSKIALERMKISKGESSAVVVAV